LEVLREVGRRHRDSRCGAEACALAPHALCVAWSKIAQMRSSQSRCSGFMSTVSDKPDRNGLACRAPSATKKGDRNLRDREMQISSGSRLEDLSREDGGFLHVCRARGKNDDVQLLVRRASGTGHPARAVDGTSRPLHGSARGSSRTRRASAEGAGVAWPKARQRQPGPRALETDFARWSSVELK